MGDGGDFIVHLEFALDGRRAAGDEFDDLRVPVLAAQHRADADERQAHVDGEILHLARTHVLAVRIVRERQRVEEILRLVLLGLLVQGAQETVVPLADDGLGPGEVWLGLVGSLHGRAGDGLGRGRVDDRALGGGGSGGGGGGFFVGRMVSETFGKQFVGRCGRARRHRRRRHP